MGVGLEPTGYWFYIVPQDGTEMERFRPDISLTVPPGAYTGDMAYDHTTVSTTDVSRMNVEYDQKSGLWCFAIYQWGYHRVNPNDKGGRMIGGYAESGDEWRLVRNLFTVFNGKLIPVARYFLGREFERNGIRTDGAVSPGWFLEDGHLCFRREDGTKAVGWMMEDGDWYYFDAEGIMQTGWIDDGGKRYYLDRNGVMVTGSVQVDGVLQVFGEDGAWQGER